MLAFSVLVAGSFSFGARVATMMEPIPLMALRFVIAGIIVGAVLWARGGFQRIYFAAPWRFLILGLVIGSYFVLMFEGLKTATPVSTAAVFTLSPLLAAVIGIVIWRQMTTGWMWAALLLGAAGALWVVFRGEIAALLAFDVGRGEAIYFVGCITHAAYPALVHRFSRGEPALAITFGMILGALVFLVPLSLFEWVQTDWGALPPVFWATLFYLAVFTSAMTFFLLQFASVRLPGPKVMAYTYMVPSWVILLEFALTGQVPALWVLIGAALTTIALLMLLRDK